MSNLDLQWTILPTTIIIHDNIIIQHIIHKFFHQLFHPSKAIFPSTAQHLVQRRRHTMAIFISQQNLLEMRMDQVRCFQAIVDSMLTIQIIAALVRIY